MTVDPARWAVLTVDLGTGGPKTSLVTLDGTIHFSEFTAVETERPSPGRALQDAEEWWRQILASARRGLDGGAVRRESVRAVAVTGQWSSVVPTRADLSPAGPCRMWLDTSASRHSQRIVGGPVLGYDPRWLTAWLRRTAGVPSPRGGDPVSHMLGFQHDEPGIAAGTAHYLEPVDHLTSRFAGRVHASAASMCGTWLVDIRDDRTAYASELVSRSGIDPGKLPPLSASGGVVGTLAPAVAAVLGLADDVAVVAGTPDLHAAWVGSGALGIGQAHLAISTTSWISCAVAAKKTDALHSIATVPGLTPEGHLVADNHEAAGASLTWLRSQVVDGSYEELCDEAIHSPAGSNGVLFQPWLAGMRSPVDDRSARGGWTGMSLQTTRADLIRSVLEGVALQSRWLLGPVEKFAGTRFDALRILGGGAQSDLWCQIHADALGRRVERVREPMAAQSRGAALIAALALGVIGFDDVPALVPVDRAFVPDPQVTPVYDALARELPKVYSGLKGTFSRLRSPR